MKIAVAQIESVKGDIQQNIERHKKLITLAIVHGVHTVIFPELSLTGYEPELAEALATTPNDSRLNDFQVISDENQITIGVGLPIRAAKGIQIGLVLFQPNQQRQVYTKKYLHEDELPFFVSGENDQIVIEHQPDIALAICYELSVEAHAQAAFQNGATIYIASVAKSKKGVKKASKRLIELAKKYTMTVLMSNSIGQSSGFYSAGQSAIWNNQGVLLEQFNETEQGILILESTASDSYRDCL